MQRSSLPACQTGIMRTILLLIIVAAALGSCRKDKIDLADGQRFLHALVPNQQECDRIRQNSIVFNCFQSITFGDDKQAMVVVTDIQNQGKYKRRGSKIIIEFDTPYDVERKMELEIVDKNTLRYKGSDFKRWKGPGVWDFY